MTGVRDQHIAAPFRRQLELVELDPDAVEDVIARAIDEDLDGGVDITTEATVPPE